LSYSNPSDIKIKYIAGYGRSGTTLIDILIGNIDMHFSAGELSFFATNGIRDNEFCSCGQRVHNCVFWSQILLEWNEKRILTLDEYISIYYSKLRNKRAFSFLFSLIFPNKQFLLLIEDTKLLYQIIWKLNGERIIVDSSKSPYRLLLLRKCGFNITVIHAYRSLRGVLYSTRKLLTVDPKIGIEKQIKPRNRFNVLYTWILSNLLTRLFSTGIKRIVLNYENLIANPLQILMTIENLQDSYIKVIEEYGPFFPRHIVAGGRVRMQREVWINKNITKDEKYVSKGFFDVIIVFFDRLRW
jgi:hypothetical protein